MHEDNYMSYKKVREAIEALFQPSMDAARTDEHRTQLEGFIGKASGEIFHTLRNAAAAYEVYDHFNEAAAEKDKAIAEAEKPGGILSQLEDFLRPNG